MPKKKDYSIYLEDILDSINIIQSAVQGLSIEDMIDNKILYAGIERHFEIIGEAANRIPREIQDKHQEIPWSKLVGMRNFIIHEYEKVLPEIIWYAIEENLPTLKSSILELINANK